MDFGFAPSGEGVSSGKKKKKKKSKDFSADDFGSSQDLPAGDGGAFGTGGLGSSSSLRRVSFDDGQTQRYGDGEDRYADRGDKGFGSRLDDDFGRPDKSYGSAPAASAMLDEALDRAASRRSGYDLDTETQRRSSYDFDGRSTRSTFDLNMGTDRRSSYDTDMGSSRRGSYDLDREIMGRKGFDANMEANGRSSLDFDRGTRGRSSFDLEDPTRGSNFNDLFGRNNFEDYNRRGAFDDRTLEGGRSRDGHGFGAELQRNGTSWRSFDAGGRRPLHDTADFPGGHLGPPMRPLERGFSFSLTDMPDARVGALGSPYAPGSEPVRRIESSDKWNPLFGIQRHWKPNTVEASQVLGSGNGLETLALTHGGSIEHELHRTEDRVHKLRMTISRLESGLHVGLPSSEGHVTVTVARPGDDGRLGITVKDLMVTEVPDQRAREAGWAVGDHILKVNGVTVASSQQFGAELAKAISAYRAIGKHLVFDIWRHPVGSAGSAQHGTSHLVGQRSDHQQQHALLQKQQQLQMQQLQAQHVEQAKKLQQDQQQHYQQELLRQQQLLQQHQLQQHHLEQLQQSSAAATPHPSGYPVAAAPATLPHPSGYPPSPRRQPVQVPASWPATVQQAPAAYGYGQAPAAYGYGSASTTVRPSRRRAIC